MITCKACKATFGDYIDMTAEAYRRRQLAGLKTTPSLAEHHELDLDQSEVASAIIIEHEERKKRPRRRDEVDV